MNTRNYLKALCTLCLLCALCVACNDDKECVPPAFKGFTYQPNPAHAGDTVTITACYLNRGQYVYGPRYDWIVTLDTLDAATGLTGRWQYSTNVTGSVSGPDPSIKFAVPRSAVPGTTVTCNFTANYNNSVDGVPGTGVSNTTLDGYYGTFDPSTVTGTLYSRASGRLTFRLASQ